MIHLSYLIYLKRPHRTECNCNFGVRYTDVDVRGLPSGLFVRKIWGSENKRATTNSTRCPRRPPCAPTKLGYLYTIAQDET